MQRDGGAGGVVDIGTLIDHGPWTRRRQWVAILCALTITLDGFDNVALSLAIPSLVRDFGTAQSYLASVLALGLVGMALGTACGGYVADRCGRRITLIACTFIFAVTTFGIAFVHDLTSLATLRFLCGLGLGGAMPVASALVAEYTPLRQRSVVLTLIASCTPLGGILVSLLAAAMLGAGWRTLFVIGGGTSVLVLVVLVFTLPESPRFLAASRKRRHELARLMTQFDRTIDPRAEFTDRNEAPVAKGLRSLFSKEYRAEVIKICGAFYCMMMAAFLLQNWTPSVLVQLDMSLQTMGTVMAVANFTGLCGSVVGAFVLGRFGSRRPMILFSIAAILSAVLLMAARQEIGVSPVIPVVLISLLFSCAAIVQTSLYTVAAYAFPAAIRGTGIGLAIAIGRVGAMSSAFLGAYLLGFGVAPYFAGVALFIMIALLLIIVIRGHVARAW